MDRDERRRAFEELYLREFPGAVRTAYLVCGDREEAMDVAQEAFARAFERWPAIEQIERPGAWIHTVVTNLAISWLRRHRVAKRKHMTPAAMEISVDDPGIVAALRLLTPAQRAVVVLRYYVDLSVDEVARALGKRPGTVRVLAHKGLERLRQILPREEVG